MADLQLPRFTSSLRAFTKVVDPTLVANQDNLYDNVQQKRKRQDKIDTESTISWKQLSQIGQSLTDYKLKDEVLRLFYIIIMQLNTVLGQY